MTTLCNFLNCTQRATYGLTYGCPLRCKEHKENYVQQYRICKCGKKRPLFNNVGEKRPIYCMSCKTEGMVDVCNKSCYCGKGRANFNEPDKKVGKFCSLCKSGTMININSQKCRCGLACPNYNFHNETKAICCLKCKEENMVDVIHKKCRCKKGRPTFNEPGQKIPICCQNCKSDNMIDVLNINKLCQCGKKRANFNFFNETKPLYCADCKLETMVNITSKKCRCGLVTTTYNFPNQTTAVCCIKCKMDGMVDIVHKKCIGIAVNGCPYDQRGNSKYRNYCVECFRRKFPFDSLTFQIRCKTKEIAVRDFINSVFEGFQHDKSLETSHCNCTVRRRIDHRKLIDNTLLVIETDENQHKTYNKMDEETRYDDLYMAYSGKWIYIRFNPDKYIDKNGKTKNPNIATRLNRLKYEVDKQIKRIEREENEELVERLYLYYDGFDDNEN